MGERRTGRTALWVVLALVVLGLLPFAISLWLVVRAKSAAARAERAQRVESATPAPTPR